MRGSECKPAVRTAMVAVPPALSVFLGNGHLPRVSRQSVDDEDYNEIKPAAEHRSAGTYLIAEKNSVKPQLGDRRAKSHRLKLGSLLPNKIGGITQHLRK